MEIDVLTGSPAMPGMPVHACSTARPPPPTSACWSGSAKGRTDAGLAAPPVVLPDFCHKAKSEMPSSIAVATSGRDPAGADRCRAQLRDGADDAGLSSGRPRPFGHGLLPAGRRAVPQPAELAQGTDRYARCSGPPPKGPISPPSGTASTTVRARPHRGTRPAGHRAPTAARARAARELPWLVVQMSRLRFGTIGPSTHFLELQEVEEILDPAAAAELGIRPGQVTRPVPQRRWRPHRPARRAVRPAQERVPHASCGDVRAEAACPPADRRGRAAQAAGWPPTSPRAAPQFPLTARTAGGSCWRPGSR